MSDSYRKKLIEVALPLEAISEESSRRKRKAPAGYPTTFHKWWAQRPLAACRAVIFASVVDDPDSDPTFRKHDGTVDEDRAGERRAELFNLIEELVKWENSKDDSVLSRARAEIAASIASRKIYDTKEWTKEQMVCGDKAWAYVCRTAKAINTKTFLAQHAPPVLDPFCGGGSIPLEAQRLGLKAYGSDLNPVPVIITKGLIEVPPRFGNKPPVNPEARRQGKLHQTWQGAQGMAADIRYYGKRVREEVHAKVGKLYPKVKINSEIAKGRPDLKPYVGEEMTVIAWLWARTVESPDPAFAGVHVPLVRSYWLSTKAGREVWLSPLVDRQTNQYRFAVKSGKPDDVSVVRAGTKIGRGCKFRCLLSGQPIPEDHIKDAATGGTLGVRMLAIVVEGKGGRIYLPAITEHEAVADEARRPPDTSYLDAELAYDPRNLWCLGYGLDRFAKLFTTRQIVALHTFSQQVGVVRRLVQQDSESSSPLGTDTRPLQDGGTGPSAYADAISLYLAAALSRAADYNSILSSWRPKDNAMRSTFAKQALPMMWDFAEANVFGKSSSGFDECVEVVARSVEECPAEGFAEVNQLDATAATRRIGTAITCTDPPYYSNISYADLSDFLYVWLRRTLAPVFPSLFSTLVTPKNRELIASPYRHEGGMEVAKQFFEDGLRASFDGVRSAATEYPTTVFYAFKQTEADDSGDGEGDEGDSLASTGWETMLSAFSGAGFVITGTWPMRTEGDNRSVGIGTNALASSIVLVGRPRSAAAPLATRREFLTSLKRELPAALKHLQSGNIAPVDLAQAAIGPGMSIFTRYAKVMEADGSPMRVRNALLLINQTLDEVLAEQEGEFDADTRWALAWFEQFGMDEGLFGEADVLARAKNTAVNALTEAGVVHARAGKVRLLKREELQGDWNPSTDTRLRHWEIVQHLIHALEIGGETAAADILRKLGGDMGEIARDLAYRLYNICERKNWASEALAYNGLVIAWPEIVKLAAGMAHPGAVQQGEMFTGGES